MQNPAFFKNNPPLKTSKTMNSLAGRKVPPFTTK